MRYNRIKYPTDEKICTLREALKGLAATSLAHFVNDGSFYVFIMLYPILVRNYSLSVLEIGVLAGLQSIFSVGVSPLIGRKSDASKNYGLMMALGLMFLSVGIAGYALTVLFFNGYRLFFALIPFAAIAGVGSSFYHPLGSTVLSLHWGPKDRGKALGINGSIGSIGRTIYPLLVIALVVSFTIPSVLTLSAFGLVAGLVVIALLRRSFSNLSNEAKQPDSEKTTPIPIRAILSLVIVLTIVSFIRGLFTIGMVSLIPTYLTTVDKISYGYDLGVVVFAMNVTPIFSQSFFGWMGDKIGRRTALGIANAGSVVAMILFLRTSGLVYVALVLAMFGFFTLTAFPLIMSLTSEIVPERASTTAGSLVWGVGNVGGGALGPVVIGLLAEPAFLGSLTSAFYIMAIVGVFAVVLVPFVPRPSKAE